MVWNDCLRHPWQKTNWLQCNMNSVTSFSIVMAGLLLRDRMIHTPSQLTTTPASLCLFDAAILFILSAQAFLSHPCLPSSGSRNRWRIHLALRQQHWDASDSPAYCDSYYIGQFHLIKAVIIESHKRLTEKDWTLLMNCTPLVHAEGKNTQNKLFPLMWLSGSVINENSPTV